MDGCCSPGATVLTRGSGLGGAEIDRQAQSAPQARGALRKGGAAAAVAAAAFDVF